MIDRYKECSMLGSVAVIEKRGLIDFRGASAREFMQYEGTLAEVVEELKTALADPESNESFRDLFLYTPRLLIGLIDYGIETNKNVLRQKHAIEQIGIDIFAGKYEQARDALERLDLPEDSRVVEKPDTISWCAFEPQPNADLIYKISRTDTNYLVLDGHDGYRPGFMVSASLGIPLCGVRNSLDSGRDKKPRPLAGEEDYLCKTLHGKNVLVLGEDISTGRAVNSLCDWSKKFSPASIKVGATLYLPGEGEDPIVMRPNLWGDKRNSF